MGISKNKNLHWDYYPIPKDKLGSKKITMELIVDPNKTNIHLREVKYLIIRALLNAFKNRGATALALGVSERHVYAARKEHRIKQNDCINIKVEDYESN